jgi:hypothetical protein
MLASITNRSLNEDDLVDVDPDNLVTGMGRLKKAALAAVDFLEGQLKVRSLVFLPFPIMMIPIVNFYEKIKKPNAIQTRQLKKWFWQCSLTLKYKAGTNRLVLEDLEKIQEVANGGTPFDDSNVIVKPDIFSSPWRINSTAAKSALCLMAQLRPKSFLTGTEVDLGTVLSAYNARQFHHIYPKGYLNKIGVGFHEANIIANICFLSATENNTISDNNPEEYFKDIPSSQAAEIFASAVIPATARSGKLEFKEFISLRTAMLKEVGNKLILNGEL